MISDYEYFKAKILKLTGFDLNSYKEQQIRRRLSTLMQSLGVNSFAEYYHFLEKNPQHLDAFFQRVTINVSEFFRNPERFQELSQVHLPALLERNPTPRIWSAGASTGEEPYTMAMILLELVPRYQGKILATDLDQEALDFAAAGVYPPARLRHLPPGYREKYFFPEGENFRVKDRVKDLVTLQRHDLLQDPFPGTFDLILCRNVVIYFTEKAKERLYKRFYEALNPGGILFTGATEQIFNSRELGFINLSPFFYQRKE